jgi:hypothetical protein
MESAVGDSAKHILLTTGIILGAGPFSGFLAQTLTVFI